jgi:hypothetical protein
LSFEILFNLKCYFGEFILYSIFSIYFIFIRPIISSIEKVIWTWLIRRIYQKDLDKRKNILSYEEPVFVKNREAVKQTEMLTESISQLILQIYIFQSKNDVLNFFTSSVEIDFLYLSQIGSIIISKFLITFGLISI